MFMKYMTPDNSILGNANLMYRYNKSNSIKVLLSSYVKIRNILIKILLRIPYYIYNSYVLINISFKK